MRRVGAVVATVLLAGTTACAQPAHLGVGVGPAYPTYAYGPSPYAALPYWGGGGHRHHHHWGGHGGSHHHHRHNHHHGGHHRGGHDHRDHHRH